ncbi:MAG: hypothetical protein SPF12_03010, partial [Prevotella sp.]|nr:hypothetical protein [Prevotella sp.]
MLVTELGMTVFLHPHNNIFVAVSIIALLLLRESSTGLSASTVIVVRPEQPSNAPLPMLVTELGMDMPVRPEQLSNALKPMLVTELGMD